MPSKSRHWFTHHDDLVMLHITSDDPRRDGLVDLAFFEKELYPAVSIYTWKILHGRIENEHGKSLLATITGIHKCGSIQIEQNPDYTRRNLTRRTGLIGGNVEHLKKYMSDPNWKDNIWKAKHLPKNFKRERYVSRSEWKEVFVEVEDGAKIAIKINKCLMHMLPTRLCFRPKRKRCTLFLCPNKDQMKRQRYFNDRRHGRSLAEYLMEKYEGTQMSHLRTDMYDFRISEDGMYTSAVWHRNVYTQVDEGTLLEVIIPQGYPIDLWELTHRHVWPKGAIIGENSARTCYYLVDNVIANEIKEFSWKPVECGMDAKCSRTHNDKGNVVRNISLKRFITAISGVQVNNINIAPRISKYYQRAIEADDYKARAKFENTIVSDITTNNRMYTKPKNIKYRRVHADKHVVIPSKNVIALDLRLESIRVGGQQTSTSSEAQEQ